MDFLKKTICTFVKRKFYMNDVCLIVPYFGKLPNTWHFYVDSLKRNPFLHLLLITDINLSGNLPHNIKVLNLGLKEFYSIVEDKLQVKIPEEVKTPYKICDLKPVLGYIFADKIINYKYWAFGDIDVVYGNLERFLKKPINENADVISFREDWISGAFTVIKNISLLNELFKSSLDFSKVLNTPDYCGFDECGAKYPFLKQGLTPDQINNLKLDNDIYCFTSLVHDFHNKKQIKLFTHFYIKESLPWGEVIDFRNGKIIGAEIGFQYIEYALYHFLHYKNKKHHHIPSWREIPEYYYIAQTGIYSQKSFKYYYFLAVYRLVKGRAIKFFEKIFINNK